MRRIAFTKMVASGNDFVVINNDLGKLARKICDRKFGIGADGLLVLGKSKRADVRMRIFNADGSEAQMCGNGARCAALFTGEKKVLIETRAGIIASDVRGDNVKIRLTNPKHLKLNIPIKVKNRTLHVNLINTGVPHAVIFVEGLDKIDVVALGREIRNHIKFKPQGTNVDFVEVLDKDSIKVRTYERGVEDETLACGTGAAASALLTTYHLPLKTNKLDVFTHGEEVLKVYFDRAGNGFSDVWLEGKVKKVCKGVYYV